jgi:NAD(P)-dependent dehydrogenase (short-subunit alcohol dehydrogenase family)
MIKSPEFPLPAHAAQLFAVDGLRAVVTGAASGIGLAMAEVLALNGAQVVLADKNVSGVEKAAERLRLQGCTVSTQEYDIADVEAVDRAFADVDERLGGVDVVCANAGVNLGVSMRQPGGAIDQFPLSDWKGVLDIDLSGSFHTMRAASRIMKRQRSGSIIVTSSTSGVRAEPMVGYAYVAAKAALNNVVQQASIELARYNVRINALAAGPFYTNIGKRHPLTADDEARWCDTIPVGRRGDPSEIKGVTLLLASPASSFVTGAIWTIDGGASALTQGRMSDTAPIVVEA